MSKHRDAAVGLVNTDIAQDKPLSTRESQSAEAKQSTAHDLLRLSASEKEIIRDAFSLTTARSNQDG